MNSNEVLKYLFDLGYYVKNGKVISPYTKKERALHLKSFNRKDSNKIYYYCFNVKIDNKYRKISVHRLVAYQKYGEKLFQKNIVVRHKNGNSLDNSESNILIGTPSDNRMDIPKKIRVRISSEANRRFNKKEVLNILEDRKNGMTYKEIGEKYNISKSTLSYFFNNSLYVKDYHLTHLYM